MKRKIFFIIPIGLAAFADLRFNNHVIMELPYAGNFPLRIYFFLAGCRFAYSFTISPWIFRAVAWEP